MSATSRAARSTAARSRSARLVDNWSLLELPLLVTLTLPSSAADDPQANSNVRVLSNREEDVTPETQRDWITEHVPLLLAKNAVQVVLESTLDATPHHYPHSGVFDADDKPKPALEALRKIRQHI